MVFFKSDSFTSEYDKPWFDDKCKDLPIKYCKALYIFNLNKSYDNHKSLNSAKKTLQRLRTQS